VSIAPVLILSWEYPPLIEGGLARHVRKLSENLARNGTEVHVLTRGGEESPPEEIAGGVHIHRVREPTRPTDLGEFVERAVHEMDTRGRAIEIEVEPASVQIDQAKTERILENLLSNSLRHTPEDAKIWVRARPHDDGVLFVVEDDGPGVPQELREAIFEPFRQAPGSSSGHAPGVGIGLSLVRRFAELHGGTAWAEEREGGGASFHVFLPGS